MKKNKLYIRTDMNECIATGHVMRCLAIAEAAKPLEIDTVFILADDKGKTLIESKGYQTIVLHSIWNEMEAELPALFSVIQENDVKTILIDSYMVTSRYLEQLQAKVKIIYIDDLDAFDYSVDVIIAYSIYSKNIGYEKKYSNRKLLIGCDYTPLRAEFSNMKQKKISSSVDRLLLLTGGTDNFNILENILKKIDTERCKQIDVVCGRYYKDYEYIVNKYKGHENIHFYKSVVNIIDFMKKADIVISAGGTTLYELCAVGTPTITYSLADNQLENVRQFDADGIMEYAGDVRYDDVFDHISMILEKYADEKTRQNKSQRMQELVDGNGASRIAEMLCCYQ